MAAGDTQITIAGNLVDDPELRYTPTGQAVAKFRVASTPRFRDNASGEWKDGARRPRTWPRACSVACG
jgi:single-strand DNA-binding protein